MITLVVAVSHMILSIVAEREKEKKDQKRYMLQSELMAIGMLALSLIIKSQYFLAAKQGQEQR